MCDDTSSPQPVLIPLRSKKYPGLFAIVDAEDAESVSQFQWRVTKDHNTFYAYRYIPFSKRDRITNAQAMHRFILNAEKGTMIDHANRNGLDNRKENLRFATNRLNQGNGRLRANRSGYRGVKQRSAHRWEALIRIDGVLTRLGSFSCPIEAAKAYDRAAREVFGEFATADFGE